MITDYFRNPGKAIPLLLSGTILISSCTSSTLINSQPTGAKLYVNGQYAGVTPYQYSDTKIVGSTTDLRLEKDGYEPLRVPLVRNERADGGAIIGGIFLLFPFLWTMKYDPEHTYELRTPGDNGQPMTTPPASFVAPTTTSPAPTAAQTTGAKSKADRLRENKRLFDEKVLTEKEYEAEKKKILDSNDN
ncbi:PEGA domain-containing protein [Fibrella sp. HMF5335]|uniref:PEGA domain-containing protein n=1 Tax=Fibrella rubiginis TaxID=2817060 RepID=A0A939GIE5_9BACT|nr:PEGA domain-containing protein [Fibrella rubiginis]MBO0939649.1 PEGA domain-containing protein [Fibrella rubiginis]